MRSAPACVFVAVLAGAVLGCGGDRAGSARGVAETYVRAVAAEDWQAACGVSVRETMEECVDVLREVYGSRDAEVPSIQRTEAVVEEVDGRNLVHFEYVLIK